MHTIKITSLKGHRRRSQTFFCPSTWTEVTPEQARKILPIVLSEDRSESVSLRLLSLLIKGVSPFFLLTLDAANVQPMLECVKFVFEEPLSVPVIPYFDIGNAFLKERYFLPAEKLENITCFEWWVADDYYSNFLETNDMASLDKLVATLCREVNQDAAEAERRGDVRIPIYSRMEVDKRAAKQKKLNAETKAYVLFFFSNCKKWIFDQFGEVLFEQPDELEEGEEPTDDEENDNPLGWYGQFQKAAETSVFGILDDILYKVKFLDFCTFMVAKRLEYDKLKREQDRRTPIQNDY